ncbi:hypothetical protein OBBRIDRAFT_247865 [Obba rivulosa]|uniref:Uncharacterized protein n=1 Tax=Obba rivulosa TaxID=1052685 RepID=A0A8E2AQL7_9APHY|nr:hypothetical protein OBBRIDRAFT_247865 [Obba rivulosa]
MSMASRSPRGNTKAMMPAGLSLRALGADKMANILRGDRMRAGRNHLINDAQTDRLNLLFDRVFEIQAEAPRSDITPADRILCVSIRRTRMSFFSPSRLLLHRLAFVIPDR